VLTVVETHTFQRQADKVWSAAQRHAFIDWIASNPTAGDVIAGADGARKVRWGALGRGKRGGVRVIYFNLNAEGRWCWWRCTPRPSGTTCPPMKSTGVKSPWT
jgi:hypothetical protein